MEKVSTQQKIAVITIFLILMGLVPCSVSATNENQTANNPGPFILPTLVSISSFLLNKSISGIQVLGQDETCYQIYDEKGALIEKCAELRETIKLPPGIYTLNLNNSTQTVTVYPREILTVYTGRITFTGSGSIPIYYPDGTEPITEVTEQGRDLFTDQYEYPQDARRVPLPVKPLQETRIVQELVWILIPRPSGPSLTPPPADIITVECDGSTMPSEEYIMRCLENKTSNLKGKFKGMVRSAVKAALQNIGLSVPGTQSNVSSILSDAFALNEPMASAPSKDEWKKLLNEYINKDSGCGLPFGHAVICND